MRNRCARVLAGLTMVLVLCPSLAHAQKTSSKDEDGPPAVQIGKEKLFPVNTNWVADSLDGKQLWSGADRPSIYVDKQLRLKGYDGCNMFSVTAYPLKQQKIVVGPLAVGTQACDKTVVATERSFLNAVRGAKEWDMEGANTLIVKGLGGTVRFERGL
ncbi:MAG: META domain-containing protein [Hyphomicrobiales bacterium]|nr:META domain-containing protein [Hyphomicrobiales bacterium]MBV9138077.1 META domain-containing protein [Hyphomicrobiales bacterium]MBV9589654.1 META domain-containing protein [Hyphomicrobiales bacterium]